MISSPMDRPIPHWREIGLAGFGFLVTSAVFCFPTGIGMDQVPFDGGDAVRTYLPAMVRSFQPASAELAGPWDPTQYTGLPESHSPFGRYYPPTMLLFRTLPAGLALAANLVLHHAWAALGMYLLSRGTGLGRSASALAGIVFGFGGFLIFHRGHVPNHQAAAWLPWGLWALERFRHRQTMFWVAASGTAIAGTALPGHLQMIVLAGVLWIAYAFYFAVVDLRQGRSPGLFLAGTAGACVIGALGGMPQLLPMIEVARWSDYNAFDSSFYYSGSLHPKYLVGLLNPHWLKEDGNFWGPVEQGIFFGLIPLVLAIFGLASCLRRLGPTHGVLRNGNTRAGFFGLLLLLSLLLILGKYGLVYPLLQFVPIYNLFHAPARHVWLFGLALAWWSAIGLESLQASNWRWCRPDLRKNAARLAPVFAALELFWMLGDFEIHPVSAGPTTRASCAPDYIDWIRNRHPGPVPQRVLQQQGAWKSGEQKHPTPSHFAAVWGVSGLNGYCQSMPNDASQLLRLNKHGHSEFLRCVSEERGLSSAGGRYFVMRGLLRDCAPGKGCRLLSTADIGWRGAVQTGPKGEIFVTPDELGVATVLGKMPLHSEGYWLIAGQLRTEKSTPSSVKLQLIHSSGARLVDQPSLHSNESGSIQFSQRMEVPKSVDGVRFEITCSAQSQVQISKTELWLLTEDYAQQSNSSPTKLVLADLEKSLSEKPFRHLMGFDGDVQVYENPNARDVATMMREVRPCQSNQGAVRAQLADRSRPARELAFVTAPGGRCGSGTLAGPLQLPAGCCEITSYRGDRIAVETQSPGEGFLTLAVTRAAGWQAVVDDTPTPIESVDGALMGVWLSPGKHRIVFSYRPVLVYTGIGLAAIGIGGAWLVTFLLPYCGLPARNLVPVRSYSRRAA